MSGRAERTRRTQKVLVEDARGMGPALFGEEGGDGVVEDGVVSVEGGLRIHVDCAAG